MSDIYVKFHKHAVESGIIRELGAERSQTLLVMATFMNDRGKCFPSQDLLAEYMGIRRETVNRRIKALCDFRWQGQPIMSKEQTKHPTKRTYLQNTYYISEVSGFKFGADKDESNEPCDVVNADHVTLM